MKHLPVNLILTKFINSVNCTQLDQIEKHFFTSCSAVVYRYNMKFGGSHCNDGVALSKVSCFVISG